MRFWSGLQKLMTMKINTDLRSFFKFIGKNRMYTIINVFGLSVSLMFVILIAAYTEREMNIDGNNPAADRIYVLANEESMGTAVPTAYWLEESFPEIEKVCPAVFYYGLELNASWLDSSIKAMPAFVDSTFFDFFPFRILAGAERGRLLEGEYDAVVSERFASRMFGKENPVGKSIKISDSTSVTVTGVMEDIDRSIVPYSDILCRIERLGEFNPSLTRYNSSNAGNCVAFLMEKEGADLKAKEGDILELLKQRLWTYNEGFYEKASVIPLRDAYFSSLKTEGVGMKTGDRRFSMILMSVGILVLLFSVINYINLTVAQSGQRFREMAMRRLLGDSRTGLFLRLMVETTVITVISFAIGLLLAYAALPYACGLMNVGFTLEKLFSPEWIAAMVAVMVLTGVLSGLLPATYVSSVQPMEIVRGSFRRKTKMVFSKIFIIFQDVITVSMIAASLIMVLQVNHLIKAPLGYNTRNVLEVPAAFNSWSELMQFSGKLGQMPCVNRFGYSNGTPTAGTNNLSGTYEDKSLSFQQMLLDSTAFDILGLSIKLDNHAADPLKGMFLNETAFRQMGIPETAESFRYFNMSIPVNGVINDFHLWGNITEEKSPVMLTFGKIEDGWWPWTVVVEVQGDPVAAYGEIRDAYESITGMSFGGEYTDSKIRRNFESNIRLAKIVSIFTVMAIMISMLGLIAMSIYFIRQRMREMAVRKIFGSDNAGVLGMLVGSFMKYAVIAFFIATPLTWVVMERWLSGYSYRISLNLMLFLAVGAAYMLISFVTVVFQSMKAAYGNPVECIKAE